MRGKDPLHIGWLKFPRITPAYAGKSTHSTPSSVLHRDHPRVCGEKKCRVPSGRKVVGSPPRMRGKAISQAPAWDRSGITPAYAGKSPQFFALPLLRGDHPRVCGEKRPTRCALTADRGSPPRMRGKAARRCFRFPASRITPAYAGKRLKRSHRIGHFSCILCLFHSVLHRASASGGSRAGPCAPPCLPAQNAVPV